MWHKEVSNTGPPVMPLQEYTDKTFAILDSGKASELKEVRSGLRRMELKLGEMVSEVYWME